MPETPVLLVVEDNPAHAELVREATLELRPDLVVHDVPDGEAALAFLHGPASPRVGLVLLDLNLPRVNGFEVLRAVRQAPQFVDLPVVVLTTSHADEDLRRARELGASAYLHKPLGYLAQLSLMRSLLDFWWPTPDGGERAAPA